MQSPPPFGVEGISRGLSGQPAPMAADEDPALRRGLEAQDLEVQGLGAGTSTGPRSPTTAGWRARLGRWLRRS